MVEIYNMFDLLILNLVHVILFIKKMILYLKQQELRMVKSKQLSSYPRKRLNEIVRVSFNLIGYCESKFRNKNGEFLT